MAFVVNLSEDERVEVELGTTTTIGRDAGCAIVVNDPLASRIHAEISRQSDGHYVFVDLDSTHGSFIGGTQVTRHVLKDGDLIVVGATGLGFHDEEQALEAANATTGSVAVVASEPWVQERLVADSEHFPKAEQLQNDEELQLNYERLRVAYELGRTLGGGQDLDTVLGTILDTAFQLLPAERAAILLVDPKTGKPKPYIARHRSGQTEEIVLSKTILEEVTNTKAGMIITDAGEDARFGTAQSVIAQGIRSAMVVPMMYGTELMGIMHLDSLVATGIFNAADLGLFGTIANQGALAIKNAALMRQIQDEAKTRVQFQRFLSPALVEQVVSGELRVGQSAKMQEVTVLFSDIRGFTRMSESMEPTAILAILNQYFEEMVEVLFRHNGTLDKYVGDELMALFGAPVPLPNGPLSAVMCALEMMAVLEAFNRRSLTRDQPPLDVGIGIHTGPAVCGTLGSSKTMQYTAIGDTVNTGARLCSAAKTGQIIISSEAKRYLGNMVKLEALEPIEVKGKSKPLEIYNAIGVITKR